MIIIARPLLFINAGLDIGIAILSVRLHHGIVSQRLNISKKFFHPPVVPYPQNWNILTEAAPDAWDLKNGWCPDIGAFSELRVR